MIIYILNFSWGKGSWSIEVMWRVQSDLGFSNSHLITWQPGWGISVKGGNQKRRESSLKNKIMIPLRPGYSCYCRYGYISVETTPPPSFTHPPPPPSFLFFHIWDFPTFLPKRLLNWYGRYSYIPRLVFPDVVSFLFRIAAFFPPAAGKRHVRNAKFSAVIWPGVFISNSFTFFFVI